MNLEQAKAYWIPWLSQAESLLGQNRYDEFQDFVAERALDYAEHHAKHATWLPAQGVKRKLRAYEEEADETIIDVPATDDDAAGAESGDSVGLDGDSGTGADNPD